VSRPWSFSRRRFGSSAITEASCSIAVSMPTLRSALNELAQNLASSIVDAIRSSSLEDLLAEVVGEAVRSGPGRTRGTSARKAVPRGARAAATAVEATDHLARRSHEEIANAADLVAKLMKTHPKGLRSEEIRRVFGFDAREMPRVLKEGLAKKLLISKGQKRATTYFAR
jgi:hypothetical protein